MNLEYTMADEISSKEFEFTHSNLYYSIIRTVDFLNERLRLYHAFNKTVQGFILFVFRQSLQPYLAKKPFEDFFVPDLAPAQRV